ncbi:MAG: hypothetical protein Q9161_006163 [Pseudevernia consocians]
MDPGAGTTITTNPKTDPALYENRNGDILGASLTLLLLPTVTVTLRLLSRWISRAGFWWDDATVILAMLFAWGPCIIMILSSHHAMGHHLPSLLPADLYSFYKYNYAFEFLYALAMASVKYSIILFQYRIFPIVQFRRILKYCGMFVVAFTTSIILVFIWQCTPISAFWTTFAGQLPGKHSGRCIKVERFLIIIGSINAATDFALLVLPIPILWHLKTGTPQKLLLTFIFIMGMTVCAVSIIRLIVISQFHGTDFTYAYVSGSLWTAAEPSIAVVSACIPSLRPLFVRVVWGGTHRPKPALPEIYPTSSWRSGTKSHPDRSFNRLQDNSLPNIHSGNGSVWNHKTDVYGGRRGNRRGEVDEEGIELGGNDEVGSPTPTNRIRAKTTVVLTISERVDWQDDLF